MPSACVATGRRSVPEHFLRCGGIVCSFLYAMWPECLTDNLTAEDEELRLHGLCWCSLPPSWGGLCILLPSPIHLASFVHPGARLTAFSYSCAGLPPGVCGSDWFMCSTLSTLTYLSVFISSFSAAAYVCFLVGFFLLPSLSRVWSLPPCTKWLLQANLFPSLCHYSRMAKGSVHSHSWRTLRPKMVKKRWLQPLWSFYSKAPLLFFIFI